MSCGGYQSDVNLNDINFVGDFPLDHSVGGFGNTTGVDNYDVVLDPVIQTLREGMLLEIKFQITNTTAATLDVDGLGLKPVKKIVDGILQDVVAGDLNPIKVYLLTYDGTNYQIININDAILQASETVTGISRFGNDAEIDAGLANDLAVSSEQLTRFIASKVTNLWEDKGLIDASTNPNYPPGLVGDAYTFSVAGKIGGGSGPDVQVRDVLYCVNDNGGGNHASVGTDWNIIQGNLMQATELLAGIAEIATQAEVNAGTDDLRIVTAITLKALLDGRNATELLTGLAEIATQAETLLGVDDTRIVTPFKLATKVAADLVTKENTLGNPFADGFILESTIAGVRSWRNINKRLFTAYGTFGGSLGTAENDLGSTYTMPASTLLGSASLEINISGDIQSAAGNKLLNVYMGAEIIFTHSTNTVGDWSISILGGRFNSNTFKGVATYLHNGQQAIVQAVQTTSLSMDVSSQLIRITHQNTISGLAQLNRRSFLIRHII